MVLWGLGSAGVTSAAALAQSVWQLDTAVLWGHSKRGNKVTFTGSISSKNRHLC